MNNSPSAFRSSWPSRIVRCSFTILAFLTLSTLAFAQSLDRLQRERAKDMLNAVKGEIKKNYYDPTFHGIDLDARFKTAEDAIDKATSLGQSFGIIAQAVLELNDSHTTFYPPQRTAQFDYGVRWQMIGEKCFITSVRPKSDAEKQGLKAGDEILSIEGFRPNRKEIWKVNYYYLALSPRTELNFKVIGPTEKEPREIKVATKITELKGVLSLADMFRSYELGLDEKVKHGFARVGRTAVWKMPTFSIDPANIANIMNGRLRDASNIIFDLRGNGGGLVVTLEELAGYFVEKDTKIADLKGRKKMDPQMAKTKGKNVYHGNVIVLVDANSASASEIFARFLQINERAVVIGDRSAGAVMQSSSIPMQLGTQSIVPYGMSLTNADVIMTDGNSLEHVGVTPQLFMIPTAADIAAQRDPVLAAAFELLGEKLSAVDAGKLFPYRWDDN